MKNKIILLVSFLILSISSAQAVCDFQAELGERKSKFEKRKFQSRGFPMEHVGLEVFPMLAEDVCSNQKLEEMEKEYNFLNED